MGNVQTEECGTRRYFVSQQRGVFGEEGKVWNESNCAEEGDKEEDGLLPSAHVRTFLISLYLQRLKVV